MWSKAVCHSMTVELDASVSNCRLILEVRRFVLRPAWQLFCSQTPRLLTVIPNPTYFSLHQNCSASIKLSPTLYLISSKYFCASPLNTSSAQCPWALRCIPFSFCFTMFAPQCRRHSLLLQKISSHVPRDKLLTCWQPCTYQNMDYSEHFVLLKYKHNQKYRHRKL